MTEKTEVMVNDQHQDKEGTEIEHRKDQDKEGNEAGQRKDQDKEGTEVEQRKDQDQEVPVEEFVKSSSADPIDWKSLMKSDTTLSDAARKRVFAFSASNNKSTYRKVEEAIAVIGTSETGASVSAILTWILNNYSTLDPSKLKVNVKRAVLKGLKGGRLVRSKASKKAQGVAGSFTFPAQRIKLKAVRLEGKRYLFPILQPVASNPATAGDVKIETGEANKPATGLPQVVDAIAKRRMSLDGVKASPKRVVKNRSKRAISEISN